MSQSSSIILYLENSYKYNWLHLPCAIEICTSFPNRSNSHEVDLVWFGFVISYPNRPESQAGACVKGYPFLMWIKTLYRLTPSPDSPPDPRAPVTCQEVKAVNDWRGGRLRYPKKSQWFRTRLTCFAYAKSTVLPQNAITSHLTRKLNDTNWLFYSIGHEWTTSAGTLNSYNQSQTLSSFMLCSAKVFMD